MLGEICTVMFFAPLKCLETEDREGIKCANTGLKQPHFPRCVAVIPITKRAVAVRYHTVLAVPNHNAERFLSAYLQT